eukprot:NODE_9991_length_220_cov_67.678363_g9376_i0.p1 GENE.NODE_9991_length_220_cov_67.678363_g9376_i0~~NODE_9991_length_220_cov_67.678363_g9376_i0.p1  ORF type:complete len:51 (-),score=1.33 NODE_9991_length_220_cov_67.678363_g9376_i0:40-192(-)
MGECQNISYPYGCMHYDVLQDEITINGCCVIRDPHTQTLESLEQLIAFVI